MISIIASSLDLNDPRVEKYKSVAIQAGAAVSVLGVDYRRATLQLLFDTKYPTRAPTEVGRKPHNLFEKIAHYLRENQPHTLVLHEPNALRAFNKSKYYNIPNVIYDAHEYYYNQRGAGIARKIWLFFTQYTAANKIQKIVTVSEGLKDLYQNTIEFRKKDIYVIRNINQKPAGATARNLAALTGLATDTVFIVFHGALWSGRGIEDVAIAVERLGPPFHFLCIGDGPLTNALKAFNNTSVMPAVPLSEVHSYLLGADLGVIPYPGTNLNHIHAEPNKLWDFAQAGLPIVARRLPGVARAAGDHAFWFQENGGPECIAGAIRSAHHARTKWSEQSARLANSIAFEDEAQKLRTLLEIDR